MTFHITQALVIERAIVISTTILLFGLLSIGGLSLWRRFAAATFPANAQRTNPAPAAADQDDLAEMARRLEMALRNAPRPRSPREAERVPAPSHEDAPTKA